MCACVRACVNVCARACMHMLCYVVINLFLTCFLNCDLLKYFFLYVYVLRLIIMFHLNFVRLQVTLIVCFKANQFLLRTIKQLSYLVL